MTTTYKPNESIKDLYNKLKKDFNIYAYKDNFTDFIIEQKNVGIAYIQKSYFSGFDLSTKHMPNHRTGTGFNILENALDITKANVLLAIACTASHWASDNDLSSVQKYKSFDDYISLPINKILTYKQV